MVIVEPATKWVPTNATVVPLGPDVGATLFTVAVVTVNVPAGTVLVPSVALTGKFNPDLDASVNGVEKPPVELADWVVV